MLDERRRQVAERMEAVNEEQQESLERREELLRELEFAQQMTRREKEDQEEEKRRRKSELESQVCNFIDHVSVSFSEGDNLHLFCYHLRVV